MATPQTELLELGQVTGAMDYAGPDAPTIAMTDTHAIVAWA